MTNVPEETAHGHAPPPLPPGEADPGFAGSKPHEDRRKPGKPLVHGVRAAASGAFVPENLNWGVIHS